MVKNSVVAKATNATTETVCVERIPFLKPSLFLIFGTNNEQIATKKLANPPIKAKNWESTPKLWKKNKFMKGIVSPAPTAIINVGIVALKINLQS